MSKTFENNAQKALTMASGIKTEGLDKLEAEANNACGCLMMCNVDGGF